MNIHDAQAANTFLEKGWCRFPTDPTLAEWVRHSLPAARRAVASPDNAVWLRCEGTWFVGVNALPNAADGSVGGGPTLSGAAVEFIRRALGLRGFSWDRAQISVCYPGYPGRMASESDAAHRYRIHRDAAHVDGLLAEGPDRRRYLKEPHAFILGIPMVRTEPGASPFVVWEASHEIVRTAFSEAFAGIDAGTWRDIDITEVYHATRRRVFERCRRIEIPAAPGEAYLVHRLALHGMSPWRAGVGTPDGRMVCYFRPEVSDLPRWLEDP